MLKEFMPSLLANSYAGRNWSRTNWIKDQFPFKLSIYARMKKENLAVLGIICMLVIFGAFAAYNLRISGKQIVPEGEESFQPTETSESQQEDTQKPKQEITPEEETKPLYSIDLYYNNGELSEQGIKIVEGQPPNKALEKFIGPKEAYTAKILSGNGETLEISKFELGLFANEIGQLTETYLTLQLEYFPSGKTIEIYDQEGLLKLSIDVSSFSRAEPMENEKSGPVRIVNLGFDQEDFNEGIILDKSGNANNGELLFKEKSDIKCEVGKRAGPGVINGAMFFDGISGLVKIDENRSFADKAKSFSVSAWVYPVGVEAAKPQAVVSKLLPGGSVLYNLGLLKDPDSGETRMRFSIKGENNKSVEVVSANSTPANSWSFLSAVIDGAKINIYINGTLEGEKDFKGHAVIPMSNGSSLFIGGLPSGENFNGFIDEFSLYTGGLSQEDIIRVFRQKESIEDFTKVYSIKERTNLFSFEDPEENITSDSITNISFQKKIQKRQGPFGMFAELDSDKLELPVSIKDQNQFSADLWVNLSGETQENRPIIQFASPGISGRLQNSIVFANNSGLGIASYNFSANKTGNSTAASHAEVFYQFGEGDLNLSGRWSHIAVVFEKLENSTKASLYLNSQLKASMEHGFFTGINGSSIILSGSVDEIGIYSKPLGAPEVLRLSQRKADERKKILSVDEYLKSIEEYKCAPATIKALINSKDKCLECSGKEGCACKNKFIELIDKDSTAGIGLEVKFLNGDEIYKKLAENSEITINVRQRGKEVIYNFIP